MTIPQIQDSTGRQHTFANGSRGQDPNQGSFTAPGGSYRSTVDFSGGDTSVVPTRLPGGFVDPAVGAVSDFLVQRVGKIIIGMTAGADYATLQEAIDAVAQNLVGRQDDTLVFCLPTGTNEADFTALNALTSNNVKTWGQFVFVAQVGAAPVVEAASVLDCCNEVTLVGTNYVDDGVITADAFGTTVNRLELNNADITWANTLFTTSALVTRIVVSDSTYGANNITTDVFVAEPVLLLTKGRRDRSSFTVTVTSDQLEIADATALWGATINLGGNEFNYTAGANGEIHLRNLMVTAQNITLTLGAGAASESTFEDVEWVASTAWQMDSGSQSLQLRNGSVTANVMGLFGDVLYVEGYTFFSSDLVSDAVNANSTTRLQVKRCNFTAGFTFGGATPHFSYWITESNLTGTCVATGPGTASSNVRSTGNFHAAGSGTTYGAGGGGEFSNIIITESFFNGAGAPTTSSLNVAIVANNQAAA